MPYLSLPAFPEVVAYNATTEDGDFRAFAITKGATILRETEVAVGSLMGGFGSEMHYRMPDASERWAYIFPHRLEVDAFGEEGLICSAPLASIDRIHDAMMAARAAHEAIWQAKLTESRKRSEPSGSS
jgi:hypothetical protein